MGRGTVPEDESRTGMVQLKGRRGEPRPAAGMARPDGAARRGKRPRGERGKPARRSVIGRRAFRLGDGEKAWNPQRLFHVFVFLSDSTWINAPWQGRCP
ncbi:hypothetical protein B4135_2694 [Caldibacillus debilis]|uniref:Uncharacterized protein n=1 Tax=Caldibacillus debilis TaxID=301148 RepID=A0A150LST1_9BACI|nr:hypothetical protein B4135_2694 [Caldibacillus debilis]